MGLVSWVAQLVACSETVSVFSHTLSLFSTPLWPVVWRLSAASSCTDFTQHRDGAGGRRLDGSGWVPGEERPLSRWVQKFIIRSHNAGLIKYTHPAALWWQEQESEHSWDITIDYVNHVETDSEWKYWPKWSCQVLFSVNCYMLCGAQKLFLGLLGLKKVIHLYLKLSAAGSTRELTFMAVSLSSLLQRGGIYLYFSSF